MNFNSHTDGVVRMAVALVNLLTDGEQRGRKYLPPAGAQRSAQLNALFEAARSRPRSPRPRRARSAASRPNCAASSRPAAADIDDAARQVNGMLKATGAHPSLERHDGEAWHIHFHGADEQSRVSGWAAGCATGLAIVLGGEHYDRLGVCTAPHCDRVYVDTSRNGSKRFCSTACQNRVKTAAFREARRERSGSVSALGRFDEGHEELVHDREDPLLRDRLVASSACRGASGRTAWSGRPREMRVEVDLAALVRPGEDPVRPQRAVGDDLLAHLGRGEAGAGQQAGERGADDRRRSRPARC